MFSQCQLLQSQVHNSWISENKVELAPASTTNAIPQLCKNIAINFGCVELIPGPWKLRKFCVPVSEIFTAIILSLLLHHNVFCAKRNILYIFGQSLFYLSKGLKILVYIQLVTSNQDRSLSTELHIAFYCYVMCFLCSDVHNFKGSVFHQPADFCFSFTLLYNTNM